jgi:hypothetical protein
MAPDPVREGGHEYDPALVEDIKEKLLATRS